MVDVCFSFHFLPLCFFSFSFVSFFLFIFFSCFIFPFFFSFFDGEGHARSNRGGGEGQASKGKEKARLKFFSSFFHFFKFVSFFRFFFFSFFHFFFFSFFLFFCFILSFLSHQTGSWEILIFKHLKIRPTPKMFKCLNRIFLHFVFVFFCSLFFSSGQGKIRIETLIPSRAFCFSPFSFPFSFFAVFFPFLCIFFSFSLWELALPFRGCGELAFLLRVWELALVGGLPSHPSWGSAWPVLLVVGFSGCESARPSSEVRHSFQEREVGPSWGWSWYFLLGLGSPSFLRWSCPFPLELVLDLSAVLRRGPSRGVVLGP